MWRRLLPSCCLRPRGAACFRDLSLMTVKKEQETPIDKTVQMHEGVTADAADDRDDAGASGSARNVADNEDERLAVDKTILMSARERGASAAEGDGPDSVSPDVLQDGQPAPPVDRTVRMVLSDETAVQSDPDATLVAAPGTVDNSPPASPRSSAEEMGDLPPGPVPESPEEAPPDPSADETIRFENRTGRTFESDETAAQIDADRTVVALPAPLPDQAGDGGLDAVHGPVQPTPPSTPTAPEPADGASCRIGPYTIIGKLGQGAIGVVYRVQDANGDEYALKVLTQSALNSEQELTRFLREADATRQLRRHPNIITVYDTGEDGDQHYIAMEHVPGGRTLAACMKAGDISIHQAIEYGLAMARALAFAHNEGVIHRDLKPANILINEFNQPLLADFGLAKTVSSIDLTMTGMVLGTPQYMSPEQAGRGAKEVTAQSDIYSFGVLFYEMLAGTIPYEFPKNRTLAEAFEIICTVEPRRPRKLRSEIDRSLAAILEKLLEKDLSRRYQTMAEVVSELETYASGGRVKAHVPTPGERLEKVMRRHMGITIAIMSCSSVVLGLWYTNKYRIEAKNQDLMDAGLSAMTDGRRADKFAEDLYRLKNPEAFPDSESEGNRIYRSAQSALVGGDRVSAAEHLQALARWATTAASNDTGPAAGMDDNPFDEETGVEDRCWYRLIARWHLARIRMADNDYAAAVPELVAVADDFGTDTVYGALALFEAGAALMLDEKYAEGLTVFNRILTPTSEPDPDGLETRPRDSYISVLCRVMTGDETTEAVRDEIDTAPALFQALGYWTLAQRGADERQRAAYLKKAQALAGTDLIWIKAEE